MNHNKNRIISLFLAVFTLVGCLLPVIPLVTATADQRPNTYVNSGNQIQDLIGVGMTQIGYTEVYDNITKYGHWSVSPGLPWCANFISWCIAQAELPADVVGLSVAASPDADCYNIPSYDGANYTPKPGDLFFTRTFGHVGIVRYVEGDYFYTIEGNTNVHNAEKPVTMEGLYVMTNKRRIKDYIFGTPRYQTSFDKDHTYVERHETAHPHNIYYECTTCGEKYSTTKTAIVETCKQCLPCACHGTKSGYYKLDLPFDYLDISNKHGPGLATLALIPDDSIVYVYGMADGWAYVNYDNKIGHIHSHYLEPCTPPPSAPTVKADQAEYVLGNNATISWDLPKNTTSFQIRIYKDCKLLADQNLGKAQTYKLTSMEPGQYEIRVFAQNETGSSEAGTLRFTVLNAYRIKFDPRGGSNGPAPQEQTPGEVIRLSTTVPTRSGYTFLGWTDNANSNFVSYKSGDSFMSDKDTTLYAVWKSNSAVLQNLSIDRLPAQTRYLKGDTLNTAGLTLKLLYSDGSGQMVTDGFTTEGFSSDRLGTKTVTVTYGGMTVSYDVQIMTYIPGDIDLDRMVNRDDVMQLLWHISFPDKFPITVPADFKDDGKVNRDDVMQLLWHISFPDKFPLATEPQEEEPEPPVTDATEPSTEATEPSTETTEPPTETTEPPAETTDPSTETTEPPAETTDPSEETTEPPAETTEPSTETEDSTGDSSSEVTDPSTEATTPPEE